jgi:hypothetical protein
MTPVYPEVTVGPDGGFNYNPLSLYDGPGGIAYGTNESDGSGAPVTITIPFSDTFNFDGSLGEEITDQTISSDGVIVQGDLEDFLWSSIGELTQLDPAEIVNAVGLVSPGPTDQGFIGTDWDPVVIDAEASAGVIIQYNYNPIDIPTSAVAETPSPWTYLIAALALVGFRILTGQPGQASRRLRRNAG